MRSSIAQAATRGKPAALVLALALAACSDEAASPWVGSTARPSGHAADTLYVTSGGEPESIDPGKCADAGCATLVAQLFEGLTRPHPRDAHPVQGVAEAWDKSDDNRLYRFHLRADARWSDGRPVTAGDFAWAWKRALAPRTASRAAAVLYPILNGEAFHLDRIRALGEDRALLAEPTAGAPETARLAKGTIVCVTWHPGKTPGWVQVEPLARLPAYGAPSGERPGRAEPCPAPRAGAAGAGSGFVREADLVEGDGAVGVRAADDRTLEVELERPTAYFLELTAHHALAPVPRHVVEPFEARGEGDRWTRPESLVNDGAYVLDGWTFQYEITMKDNPFYWDRARLAIRRVVWLETEDDHASMNLYRTAEIDALGDTTPIPAEYIPSLEPKRDYLRAAFLSVYWYELNTKRPPLDDPRVRRALSLAIDRRVLVDKVTRGGQIPATHYVPDFTGSGYAEAAAADRAAGVDPFHGAEHDPERARALLAEAGYPVATEGGARRAAGFPPIEILYNTGEGNRQIAVAIQAMWREALGVSASLRNEEWKALLESYKDRDFQVLRYGQVAEYDHPFPFLEPFTAESPQNGTGWSDPAFEATMREAARAPDPAESVRLYRRAEAAALDAMPRIPLYFYTRSSLVKPWVRGFWGRTHGVHLAQDLWIDPAWREGRPNAPAATPAELPPPGRF